MRPNAPRREKLGFFYAVKFATVCYLAVAGVIAVAYAVWRAL